MTTSASSPHQGSPSPSGDSSPGSSAFDRETAIEPIDDGLWRTTISSAWNINTNPNGGYALTPLLRAAAASVDQHPDPVSVTTHFLRPAIGDSQADLRVELLRQGRRTSTVRATMIQDSKPRLEMMATFADLGPPSDDSEIAGHRIAIDPPDLAPPEDCVDRSRLSQQVTLPLLSRVEVRIDPRYAEPGAAGVASNAGWIRLLDGRDADSLTLPLFCDAFPPSIFSLAGRVGWVPTVELTVHVRRRPMPGWHRGRFTTREVAGALLVEDGTLWDSADRVVAQARQLAMAAE